MDPNERLLERVVQERSGRGQRPGARTGWLILAILVAVFAAAAAAVRMTGTLGLAPAPSTGSRSEVDARGPPENAPAGPTPTAIATLATSSGEATKPSRAVRYTVQSGDTLQSIAARNGLQPATLIAINDVDDPDVLQPGRTLVVPASDGLVHVVEPGETLRDIAAEYGLDVATLVDANNLSDPDQIAVGLRLFIPRARAGSGA